MTAEAHHHYEDLHRLVDRLNPDQADALRAVALQLVTSAAEPERPEDDEPVRRRHLSITGIIEAEPDLAERSEDILRELAARQL